jgi:penicillin-binding protein 1B
VTWFTLVNFRNVVAGETDATDGRFVIQIPVLNKKSILAFAVVAAVGIGLAVFYHHLSRLVDQRLQQGVFADSYSVFSAPKRIVVGDVYGRDTLISYLFKIGYTDSATNPVGHFLSKDTSLDVFPGAQSTFHDDPIRVTFASGKISELFRLKSNTKVSQFLLDPQLITSLNNQGREKRRIVTYAEIPKVLIDALLSAEDKNFFSHSGFDPLRIVRAAFVNLRSGRKEQGGSTLTMQLAKNLYLAPEKTWRRKATEFLIAGVLEQKLSKQEILLHYCNQIYLGNHDTFSLHGFGEASRIYFNKELNELTLPQAAMLAGIVQRPSYDDPIRHPDRALSRRNTVLSLMQRNGFVTATEAATAAASPLGLEVRSLDSAGQAPYFLDLAFEEARSHVAGSAPGLGSYRIYTTLDEDLQSAAADAVRIGMEGVDHQIRGRNQAVVKTVANGKAGVGPANAQPSARPQVALIAMDPHTGEVKAAIGGRSYASSQLNRLRSKRQPGSVFKPFVYTAAMETQIGGRGTRFTGASMLQDEPTTFIYGKETYEPNNFGDRYMGPVTLRRALASSLNNPAVQLAEAVGYRRVVDVAKRAGMNEDIRATPAVALGAYEVTPVEVAGAYTIFANQGIYVQPTFVSSVEAQNGAVAFRAKPKTHPAIDPKVAYLMLDMLQEVLRSGTGAAVWGYGLHLPAAGKTGTSRDGWFAGFTSDLLCVVWVGYDDNRDLDMEGAKSALPIWAEFMKRATQHGNYAHAFAPPPSGLTTATIDDESGELAGPLCTRTRNEFFVTGSEPTTVCAHIDLPKANPIDGDPTATGSAGTVIHRNPNANVGMAGWFRTKNPETIPGLASAAPADEFTAAHPDYPTGTLLRVTNISTGKSVVVHVTGRIARDSGWVISVSQQAAQALDFMQSGSAEVRVEPVEKR